MSHIPLLGQKIQSAHNILLINHIRMDPDAFGSLAGFYQILQKLGKNVVAINDESVPENFGFLGHNHIFTNNVLSPLLRKEGGRGWSEWSPDLIISFDAASIDQLGNSYRDNKKIFEATDFFVIDHHLSNPGFGQYNIIKTDYSSTCEIVYEIIEELNFIEYIDSSISSCIFTGMITDTNIFYNQNTTPNTHRVAGELMKHGANFRAPIFEFYKKKSFASSKLWGEILRDMKQVITPLSPKGEGLGVRVITYALVKREYFEKTGTSDENISGLINEFFSNIEDSDICFLLYPIKGGLIKASMRSKEIDISIICQKFGGGGHKLAGGFSSEKNITEVRDLLLKELQF